MAKSRDNWKEIVENTENRIKYVWLAVLLFALACIGMMVFLAVKEGQMTAGLGSRVLDQTEDVEVNGEDIDSTLYDCYMKASDLRPNRGEIYDDHGRLLIGNYTVFEVAFDGRNFAKIHRDTLSKNSHAFDEMFDKMAASFYSRFKDRYPKYDEKYYRDFFRKGVREQKYRTLFFVNESKEKSWITTLDTSYIKNLKCLKYKTPEGKVKTYKVCLNYVAKNVRINPYGEMARRTLGMNNETKHFGLEYAMDSLLAGKEGSKQYLEINNTVVPLKYRLEPIDGYNIHTTINLEMQNAVHNELAQKLTELNAEWGCAIVMETTTGEIKAISNLYRTSKDQPIYTETMEYGLNAKVEPGSTFKLASLLAYFENGGSETKSYPMFVHTFDYPMKSGQVRHYHKVDSKVHPETMGTPNEIFQRSSNIGIASMIFDSYGIKHFDRYCKQLEKFGFFDPVSTQLGELAPASIRRDSRFDNYYAVCFGAGFTIPILRTLMYYNAIANNGVLLKPIFVKHVTNNYDTIQSFHSEVINPKFVSNSTLEKARQYLDSVVWGKYGTGRHYKDTMCQFAGKTGTRDLWDEQLKAYNFDRNAVSFCGYFPKQSPMYTMIIYIYDVPQHSEVAVDAFRRIARGIMNSANYRATTSVESLPFQNLNIPTKINRKYFNKLFSTLGYDTIAYPSNIKYWTFVNEPTHTLAKMSPVPTQKRGSIPDVTGMIASDAVAELTRAGYRCTIAGRGVVQEQYYDAQTQQVRLRLSP